MTKICTAICCGHTCSCSRSAMACRRRNRFVVFAFAILQTTASVCALLSQWRMNVGQWDVVCLERTIYLRRRTASIPFRVHSNDNVFCVMNNGANAAYVGFIHRTIALHAESSRSHSESDPHRVRLIERSGAIEKTEQIEKTHLKSSNVWMPQICGVHPAIFHRKYQTRHLLVCPVRERKPTAELQATCSIATHSRKCRGPCPGVLESACMRLKNLGVRTPPRKESVMTDLAHTFHPSLKFNIIVPVFWCHHWIDSFLPLVLSQRPPK